jgi:hypothetical protein
MSPLQGAHSRHNKWPALSVTGEGIDPEIEEGSWGLLHDRIYALPSLEPRDKEKRGASKPWLEGWIPRSDQAIFGPHER